MQHTPSYFSLDALTLFGLVAVSAMLLFYALEERSHWFVLAFAGACAMGAARLYGWRSTATCEAGERCRTGTVSTPRVSDCLLRNLSMI